MSVPGNCLKYIPSLLSVQGNIKGEERNVHDRYLSVLKFRSLNEYLTSDFKNSEIARLMRFFIELLSFIKENMVGKLSGSCISFKLISNSL